MDEIKLMMRTRKIDILCITETWLLPSIPDAFANILHYNIYRYDKGRGGGTCIYVRDDFKATLINLNIHKMEGIDDIWLNIQCRKLPSIIVGSIYRHPHSSNATFEYLLDSFRAVSLRNKPIFILGDLNDNLLIPNAKLSKIIKSAKLCQLIDRPTRITPYSSTLLDVIITNKPEIVIRFDVSLSEIADHDNISVHINISKPKREPDIKTLRNLENYNQEIFCNSILDQTLNLNMLLNTDDVNKQLEIFNNVFNKCLNKCAPVITKVVGRPYAPWIKGEIHLEMKARNETQKRLKRDRYNPVLYNEYKQKKKRVKSMIHTAKSNYFKEEIKKCNNTKDTWKAIKRIIPSKSYTKCNYGDTMGKANKFNHFFANVGKETYEKTQEILSDNNELLDMNPPRNMDLHSNIELFRPQPATVETVILTLQHLNNSSAYGSDGIPTRFIKDSLLIIAYYVTVIINTSIVTGFYPSLWKYPFIAPLLKKGDIDDPNNFRPVSILPVLSKVLEKIVADQLMSHLESNRLLSKTQHGFRRNLSTETALIKITNEIYSNIDNKHISLLILTDLSKAFDSVSHEVLLQKCSELAIDSFWFQDYLKDRIQSVRIGDTISDITNVDYGVPQGSILGPILFLIYVNDMSRYIYEGLLVQYADDAQVVISDHIDNLQELVAKAEHILSKVKEYFLKNGLLLNAKKTQCIFIGTHQYINRIPEDIKISCGNESIIPSYHVKNLGLHMDRFMSFNVHIDEVCKKVTGILMYINRMKDSFDISTRSQIVQSLALSIINYCFIIWGTTNTTQLDRVQKLQNFAAKVAIGGARKYDHVSPIIKQLKWLKIKEKNIYDTCIMVFKILNHNFPSWLISFQTVNEIRNVETRQSNDLYVDRTRTDMGARSLKSRGPFLWNVLPLHVKNTNSLNVFRNKLKNYSLSNED